MWLSLVMALGVTEPVAPASASPEIQRPYPVEGVPASTPTELVEPQTVVTAPPSTLPSTPPPPPAEPIAPTPTPEPPPASSEPSTSAPSSAAPEGSTIDEPRHDPSTSPESSSSAPSSVPPSNPPEGSSGGDPRRDPSVRYARAAGISGGIALLLGYAVTTTTVLSMRCYAQAKRPPDPYDDYGYSDEPGTLDCWPYGLVLGSIGVAGGAVATTVLSALSGYRWAERDLRAGIQLSKKRSLGFILGGTGLRLTGLGLVIGGALLAGTKYGCPDVNNGLDSTEVDAYMTCFRPRAFGGASMVAVGLSARWVGSGMITYGARHHGHTRRQRQVQVTPYVQPSATATVAGLTGRF